MQAVCRWVVLQRVRDVGQVAGDGCGLDFGEGLGLAGLVVGEVDGDGGARVVGDDRHCPAGLGGG